MKKNIKMTFFYRNSDNPNPFEGKFADKKLFAAFSGATGSEKRMNKVLKNFSSEKREKIHAAASKNISDLQKAVEIFSLIDGQNYRLATVCHQGVSMSAIYSTDSMYEVYEILEKELSESYRLFKIMSGVFEHIEEIFAK